MVTMGSGLGHLAQQQQQHSLKIDADLNKRRNKPIYRLLLLGTAESGKSTLFRQMRILHREGFNVTERMYYRSIIISNLVHYTSEVLVNMANFNITFEDQNSEFLLQTYANQFLKFMKDFEKSVSKLQEFRAELQSLYECQAFQECVARGQEYCLGDAAQYLFTSLDRITSPDYVPTNQDILFARRPTLGIIELNFNFKNHAICMIDVGGQTSQRWKWISCFADVTSILFTAALSFYDQKMENDPNMNKLQESIDVFSTICGNRFLHRSSFILFLNKKDVFETRIQKSPLRRCFPDYSGENTYQATSLYIRKRFEMVCERTSGIYTHYTTATDTANIDKVFDTAMVIVLRQNLERYSII